jgi:Cu-Zn family superoxide dismutase
MKRILIGTSLAIALTSVALGQSELAATAKATFVDSKGKQIGHAELMQTPNGVLIEAEVHGLPPGAHAFHIHEKGQCKTDDQFKTAGDHFNPSGKKHGYETTGGPHAGDMPNQFVGQDGVLKLNVINPNVSLGTGKDSLFDQDGSALVIHAKADDYKSQPAGDAGDRIACAVVEK